MKNRRVRVLKQYLKTRLLTDLFPVENKCGGNIASKDVEELDQVAGNAEDEIGERIASVRETELLYGPESLLAAFGPMIVHIVGSPHRFKVIVLIHDYLSALANIHYRIEHHPSHSCDTRFQQILVHKFSVLRTTSFFTL